MPALRLKLMARWQPMSTFGGWFWISLFGLGLALVSGLLGVPLWRGWIQSKLPPGTDRAYDITRTAFMIVGAIIGIVGLIQNEIEKELADPWRLSPAHGNSSWRS
jgi:H+/Cl- antiporter ClcA